MKKKELPKDYWNNYEFYVNKENKEIILNNILTLPDDIVVTLYKYNKVYLDESLIYSFENKVKQNPLEVLHLLTFKMPILNVIFFNYDL